MKPVISDTKGCILNYCSKDLTQNKSIIFPNLCNQLFVVMIE